MVEFKDKKNNIICPHCQKNNWGRMIYGYTDDSDSELNARDLKDLYLAGCVPDSYGVDVEGKWFFPTKHCNFCKKFFDFKDDSEAFMESP